MGGGKLVLFLAAIHLFLLPLLVCGGSCECSAGESVGGKNKVVPLKIAAVFSILVSGGIGVCIPVLGKWIPTLDPDKDVFFLIKSFAAGVILSTGLVHILPDAFDSLTSPCLDPNPWHAFPFAGFTAMAAAVGTLMIDTLATGYFSRRHAAVGDETKADVESCSENGDIDLHETTHGHVHGRPAAHPSSELTRHRVISQVLELGIVVHSMIIGMSLGASQTPSAIRTLIAALSFHQFFEGLGLGGCIVQAKLKLRSMAVMGVFFTLTTPVGIGVGMGIASSYNESSPTALIVKGLLNSASAGILIYMALVDLLAHDFMDPRVQNKPMLQLLVNLGLLLGAGLMSLLAKWS